MIKLFAALACLLLLCACSNHSPDVSAIKVNTAIARFDNDFFQADTTQLMASLDALAKKYPYFFKDFVQHIVVNGTTDSSHDLQLLLSNYISHTSRAAPGDPT